MLPAYLASRRPNREQVEFFLTFEKAEQAGYRPCRRCQPRQVLDPDSPVELVTRACRLIETNPGESLSLNELGRQLAVSPYHLHRLFKSVTGVTPHQYAAAHRGKSLNLNFKLAVIWSRPWLRRAMARTAACMRLLQGSWV